MNRREALACLRRRQLLPDESARAFRPRLVDVSRRNAVFRVSVGPGVGLLLKQGGVGSGPGTVAHEASVYRLFRSRAARDVAARYLPSFRDYDPQSRILTVEAWPRSRTLREQHVRDGRCSPIAAARLGEALAAIHGLPSPSGPTRIPWSLAIDRPGPSMLRHSGAGAMELVRAIQRRPSLRRSLEAMRQTWRPAALTHYDLRLDNCLVRCGGRRRDHVEVKIIDWELAGRGDPAWDLGFVLGEYVALWALSIPSARVAPTFFHLDEARYPLESIHPSLRAFWSAYARVRGLNAGARQETLSRATGYAAVRLIQVGYEHLGRGDSLTPPVDRLLTLAANMADKPLDAAIRLLDLSADCAPDVGRRTP